MTAEPTSMPTNQGGAAPTSNPFAGVPTPDLVRDALALLLLLMSLAMRWNVDSTSGVKHATDHLEVVLVTLVSVASLSLTYLARAKVFGAGVSAAQVGLIRAAANAPYAVVVAIYLILDVSKIGDSWYLAGGIGWAAATGLTGAALAGMPRQVESENSPVGALQAKIMQLSVIGLGGLWVAMSLINFINVFVEWAPVVNGAASTIALLVTVLLVLVPLVLITAGLIRRSAVTRTVTVTGGVVVFGAIIIDWFSDWKISMTGVESAHRPGFGIIALITLGALASSHLIRDSMRHIEDVQRYVRSAGILLLAQASGVVASAIITVLTITSNTVASNGKAVEYIFALVIIAAMATGAFALVRTGEAATRPLALALTAGTVVVGVVAVSLVESLSQLGIVDLIYTFGLPTATLVLLAAPTSMRAHYGSLLRASGAPIATAPTDEPETPALEAKAPFDEPETPALEAKAPFDEPETPALEAEASYDEPEATYDEPEVAFDEPEVAFDESEVAFDESETPALEAKAPFDEPEAPILEPDAPILEPDAPILEPDAPILEPETPIEEPEPETPFVEPDAPILEPDAPILEPEAPILEPEAPAPESVHPRAAEASAPETPLQALFEIAAKVPELRAAVAANPSTYPDLLTWLGKLGDPAVDAALKARGA
ncbi:DUF7937 domain-containing protein [Demequina lutea]|uniref:Uncharacterized protein n=1 Tax=Demequina lutea TaxID=431489 RepID=A0A7Y9ZBX1_9MICO|nr:hypothetical protein [Demequina lutea]NYI42336.1 hypothetical protein [Demequina lutea]